MGGSGTVFWDGNKRTAMTLANKWLVSRGRGVLIISDKHTSHFNELLLNYYNTGKGEVLAAYLYDNCFISIDF